MTTLELKKIIAFCGGKFFSHKYCDEICVGVVLFRDVRHKSNREKQLIYVIRN